MLNILMLCYALDRLCVCVWAQTCLSRAMGRGDSGGARRSDDDPEVFKKR